MKDQHEVLEERFGAAMCYSPEQCVACSSGTAALHLALEALQLRKDAHVLVPDLTMIACPRAVTLAGATPVFVDCDSDLHMDLTLLDRIGPANPYIDAIMAVHIYGRQLDVDYIHRRWGISTPPIIEDLAEAHGILPHPKSAAACWSFYKNKVIAGEEGGMVAFKDRRHAALARQLRSLGFTEDHDFQHVPRGCNYRLSTSHAYQILESYSRLGQNLKKRRELEALIDEKLAALYLRGAIVRMPARSVPWVYDLWIPEMSQQKQNAVVAGLREEGCQARHCFKPMSSQDEYKFMEVWRESNWFDGSVAEKMSREVIYLPLTPGQQLEPLKRALAKLPELL